MTIKEELNNLKTTDIYSLLLFVLYKLRHVPEYSGISQLAFVLDEENFLNFCEYFGGLTIKVPTIKELQDIVDALLMYQYIDIDKMSYDEAVEKIGFSSSQMRRVKKVYTNIKSILKEYNFGI